MEPRKGARAVRAARGAVLIAAAFLGTVWAAPPEPANDRGDSLVGTLAYGKGGVIRLIVDRLPLRVPDARLQAMLVNEGAESFSVQAKDAWFATMEDGRKFAFTVVRIDNPGKLWTSLESITGKRTPRKVVLEPGDWLPVLLAPPSPLQGNLTSLELRGSDQAGSLIASDEYRPARPRLTTPVALPAAFPEPSQGFSVTLLVRVAPDGRAESITVRDRPSKESVKPGGPAFADLVVKTVASWTFDPARRAGRPEGSLLPLSVSYSSHRVFRTTVAASESVVSPKVGEYLRSTFPLYVELPELHGFAVAGPLLEGEKGLINARAWFLRVGEESGRTWIAVASRTITARDPVNGIKCGCDLITDSEDAAGRLLSALTEHLGLPASSTTILMPTAGLIPGGLAEPEAKGSWGRDAVTGLLRAALGRSEQIRQGAGRTSDKDGGKPDELGMPLGAPSLPAAAAFAPSPEPTRINFDEVVDPPRLVRKVTPDYPVMARRARIEGDVVLEAWVDEGGHVRDIQIIKGLPLLNLPSIEAVSCWEYEPAHRNGKPLPVFFTIVVTYTLRGS